MSEAPDTIGSIATGGLIAREIERARVGAPAVGHDAHEPCANCGAVRHGPYCHACGQAGHVHRNLFALVHDLAHGVFHFEGKIWNTLPLLFWRPGELTRRYVHGERAKFVSPMALFLFSVFLLFATMPHAGNGGGHKGKTANGDLIGAQTQVDTYKSLVATMPTEKARAKMREKLADAEAKLAQVRQRQGAQATAAHQDTPAPDDGITDSDTARAGAALKSVDTGIPFLNYAVHHWAENPELTAYKLKTYAYKYSWALIPISVPFIWMLFPFRRNVGGYDHAIFAIYSLSFMSLGVVVLALASRIGTSPAVIALAAMIVPPIHMYKQLKGSYGLGRFGAAWRTFALLFITLITSTLFFAFLVYMGSD